MYRTVPEKKIVKHYIELTRGEVDRIIRAHLVAVGRLPQMFAVLPKDSDGAVAREAANAHRALPALPTNPGGAGVQAPAVDEWENWVAFTAEWEEEVPK